MMTSASAWLTDRTNYTQKIKTKEAWSWEISLQTQTSHLLGWEKFRNFYKSRRLLQHIFVKKIHQRVCRQWKFWAARKENLKLNYKRSEISPTNIPCSSTRHDLCCLRICHKFPSVGFVTRCANVMQPTLRPIWPGRYRREPWRWEKNWIQFGIPLTYAAPCGFLVNNRLHTIDARLRLNNDKYKRGKKKKSFVWVESRNDFISRRSWSSCHCQLSSIFCQSSHFLLMAALH